MRSVCETKCNKGYLRQLSAPAILDDEICCGTLRLWRHSANFICLNRAALLRLVLSVMVTVMSSEICEQPQQQTGVFVPTMARIR